MKDIIKIGLVLALGIVAGYLILPMLGIIYQNWVFFAIYLGIFLIVCAVKVYRAFPNKKDFFTGIVGLLWLIALPFVWYYYQYWYTPFVWILGGFILSLPLTWNEVKEQENKE